MVKESDEKMMEAEAELRAAEDRHEAEGKGASVDPKSQLAGAKEEFTKATSGTNSIIEEGVITHTKAMDAFEKAGDDLGESLAFLREKPNSPGMMDWLFRLEKVFIPETDRKISIETRRSAEIMLDELKRNPKSDKYPELVVKVKGEKLNIGRSEAPWLAAISPTLQGFVTTTDRGSKICLRICNSGLLTTTANAPLAALLATLLSYAISSYLLPHPILLFYSLICTLPVPVLLSVVAIMITKSRYESELPKLLKGVRKIAQSPDDFIDCESEVWHDMPSRHAARDKVIAGAVSSIIYLSIAFGLHAQAWNYWVAGDYEKCAALCEPVQKLAEAVLGKDDTTVADCKYYLAESYRCMGNTNRAVKLYEEAEEPMAKGLGKENNFYADVVFNIGRCYEEQGRLSQAKEKYLQALKIWQKAFGKRNMICSKGLNRLAALSLKLGDFDGAGEYQNEVIEIDRAYGDKYARAVAEDLNDLAAIEIAAGNYKEGVTHANESMAQKETELVDQVSFIPTFINLSRAHFGLKEAVRAKIALQKAAKLIGVTDIEPSESAELESLKRLSKSYSKKAKNHREIYEVPNFDTRANMTYEGDGRL